MKPNKHFLIKSEFLVKSEKGTHLKVKEASGLKADSKGQFRVEGVS